jgi:multiple sugar transport system ATP-binding protein
MTLADRIMVMNDRRIQQVGAPMEIYTRPANAFVARFVGSPAMTLAPAELLPGEGGFAQVKLGDGATVETRIVRAGLSPGGALQLGLRPEAVRVTGADAGTTQAEVMLVERLGDRTLVYARLADGLDITAEDEGNSRVRIGDRIGLAIKGAAAHLFDADGAGHHAEPVG